MYIFGRSRIFLRVCSYYELHCLRSTFEYASSRFGHIIHMYCDYFYLSMILPHLSQGQSVVIDIRFDLMFMVLILAESFSRGALSSRVRTSSRYGFCPFCPLYVAKYVKIKGRRLLPGLQAQISFLWQVWLSPLRRAIRGTSRSTLSA